MPPLSGAGILALVVAGLLVAGEGGRGSTTSRTASHGGRANSAATEVLPGTAAEGWTDEGVRLDKDSFPSASGPVDATVVRLANGQYRIYVTEASSGYQTAVSSDGLTFAPESPVTAISDTPALRVELGGQGRAVRLSDGRIRLFFSSTNVRDLTDYLRSAVGGADGRGLTIEPNARFSATAVGARYLTRPGIARMRDGRWRAYFNAFQTRTSTEPNAIRSAVSSDMLNWTLDDGIRVGNGSPALPSDATHPSAITNPDGSITLFYFRCSCASTIADEGIWSSSSADGLSFTTETQVVRNHITPGQPFENDADPDAVVLPDGQVRLYTGGGLNRAGASFNLEDNRIKSWLGPVATATALPSSFLDRLRTVALSNEHRRVRNLSDHVLDSISPFSIPESHSLRDRLSRAENDFHHNGHRPITDQDVADLLDDIAAESWIPDWLAATADQVRAVRAEAAGAPARVFGMRAPTDVDGRMSPLEAVVVATSLVQRKARDRGVRLDAHAYRLLERWLADESASLSAPAHRWLDRLGVRR